VILSWSFAILAAARVANVEPPGRASKLPRRSYDPPPTFERKGVGKGMTHAAQR